MRLPTDCFVVARLSVVVLAVVMLLGHHLHFADPRHVETAPWHVDEAQPHDAGVAVHAGSCEATAVVRDRLPAVLAVSEFIVMTPGER